MLAYVFWHRPREGVAADVYERAQVEFHRSLSENPPAGFGGSACYRAADVPWLAGAVSYEDWYFVENYTALGLLNDAAVDARHRGTHDQVAGRFGGGAGGLYGLIEGAARNDAASVSWIARQPGLPRLGIEQMLDDPIDREQTSLWRRQFVFGPAPEYCLLGPTTHGVSPDRLPEGWSALSITREPLAA